MTLMQAFIKFFFWKEKKKSIFHGLYYVGGRAIKKKLTNPFQES